ncbi:hypothetical protein HAZT_HAZT005364 [Hyalella azteca]|uniref:Estradiol 17-beta-dehydrogenase 8 n=1 Tax=Hyalella azteca TaxID=294128 RepID=A0A6A0GQ23_HYAAZ|nr:hypothetical protein HAZT_HAZT005364 [Hyalella azteca]
MAERGAYIAATDINKNAIQDTISNLQGNSGKASHLAMECDVSSGDSVRSCFSEATKHFKQPPTLLANCAGITMDTYLAKMTEEQFDKVIQVNLKGTFLTNQAFAHCLAASAKQGGDAAPGAIVNVSSISAHRGNMGQTNYSASKAGVEGFTRSAAKELAKFGIRVNCVYPGLIETPMTDTVPEHLKEMVKYAIALKRAGQPQGEKKYSYTLNFLNFVKIPLVISTIFGFMALLVVL